MANKAKRTKSGTWRVQVYDYTDVTGKKHYKSFTARTKTNAELMAAAFAREKKTRRQAIEAGTLGSLVDEYIELMTPTLSPSTISAYKRIRAHAFPDLMQMPVSKLTATKVQQAINAEISREGDRTGKTLTPKTIKNEWGLISATLAELAGLRFSPKLPAYQVAPKQLPAVADVMAAVQGTDIELPVMLALCLGLRMSEIRGLRCSDFDGQTITIRQTMVDTSDGPVIKSTGKTAGSLRRLSVPSLLASMINLSTPYTKWLKTGADGLIEPRSRAAIYGRWQTVTKKAGISMSFHELRALNASVMLALGVPDKYAMQRGGWATPAVMKAHYQQVLDSERSHFDSVVDGYFEKKYHFLDNSAEA